jgi:hypothetical protein
VLSSFLGDRPGLPALARISHQRDSNSIHQPTQLPCAPHKLVRTPDTQRRQSYYTHPSVCKVVLRARASARCCTPVSPILFSERLHGWREQRDRHSMVTIRIINCVRLFSRRPTRLALTHQRGSNSIHNPSQLPCAPHKLARTPGTQPRQHHTHPSSCKVVLRARASARCCAPAAPISLPLRLRGWREQRDRKSVVTIQNNRLCLALLWETDHACPHWHPSCISASPSPFNRDPTQQATALYKLVRTLDTQSRQHHTHCSVCKVVLRARASARRCAPASPMLFERRLCGLCEHRDRNSVMTIIIIDCVWLFSRRPTRLALTPISHQRVSISIHHPTQLLRAPHKLVHTPDTQPRHHHTHSSSRKVVLPARAFARCCAPVLPIALSERLCGWCEHRHRNSMVTIKITNCVRLFSRRPTRLTFRDWHPSRSFISTPLSRQLPHTSLCAR